MNRYDILPAKFQELACLVLNAVQDNPIIKVTVSEANTNQIFEKARRMFEYMMDNLITL